MEPHFILFVIGMVIGYILNYLVVALVPATKYFVTDNYYHKGARKIVFYRRRIQ